MRLAAALLVLAVAPAGADTFGGFSGVDRPYQLNEDKVCTPLVVTAGKASGNPACVDAKADRVAELRFKDPVPQKGAAKATFAATASGRTLTVTKQGAAVVAWDAPDPIGKVVEVYGSQYDDRVAVAFTVRRLGKEVTSVVAFDLGKPAEATPPPVVNNTGTPAPAAPEDPKVTKAVTAARKAKGKPAIAAWKAVLAVDASHSEALFQIAALQAQAKQPDEALATLGTLAASTRPDAIEWQVEARFNAAFAALRADPAFRAKVGLDKKPSTTYERLMGLGGQWEQTGTSCDKPEVRFTATRDRVVRVRVKSRCEGQTSDLPFKGTWRVDGDHLVLTFATRGEAATAKDEAPCTFATAGDEDAMTCALGRDIEFTVLPTRR